uniref:Uncharacterized protein n=1 Tax=Arundo donax TaxID=35708 RepID=A0A0A8Y1E2_ARUDO
MLRPYFAAHRIQSGGKMQSERKPSPLDLGDCRF